MIKKFDIRLAGVVFLFILVIYLAYNFKKEFDSSNRDRVTLGAYTHTLENNYNKHIQIIEDSTVNLHFNNDGFKKLLDEQQELLAIDNEIFSSKLIKNKYKSVIYYINKHRESVKKMQSLTFKYVRINSKVKNSIYILEKILRNSDNKFDQKYFHNFVDILLDIKRSKNDVYSDKLPNYDMFRFFQDYKESEDMDKKLIFVHIDLLYRYIPLFKSSFKDILRTDVLSNIKNIRESIRLNSISIKEDMQKKFFIMLFSYILFFVLILYLIYYLKKETKLVESHREQSELALKTDSLTGLLNRNALLLDLKEIKGNKIGVILFDVIGFSDINTVIGYEGGDQALLHLSETIKSAQKSNRKILDIYKIKVDQFLITVDSLDVNYLNTLSCEIIDSVENSKFSYKGLDFTLYLQSGGSVDRPYLTNAELALDKTKDGFEKFLAYKESMAQDRNRAISNLDMLQEVKEALAEDRICPFFQPIVDLKTKEIVKYEALVRLIDKNLKPISPYFFLELSKRSKLYVQITEQVLYNSILMIKKSGIPVSINVSYSDMIETTTMDLIAKTLEDNRDIADKITFEILESDEIKNYKDVLNFVEFIKGFGCKVAIDDFGSGYSNFNQLFQIKPDILKIDGSLIKDIDKNINSRNVVKSMVGLAKDSNMLTVAEFVDHQEVDEIITKLGIDYGQGYYYSPPKNILQKNFN